MSSPVEVDLLVTLHEALVAAGRATELADRLRVLAGALATIAGGTTTLVVRDATLHDELTIRVAHATDAPPTPAPSPVGTAVWRRWLRLLKARHAQLAAADAQGAVYALDLRDAWTHAEFGQALVGGNVDDRAADGPTGLLLAPLSTRDGTVIATLVVEVPGAWPPDAALVRAIEVVGQQVAQHVVESRLETLASHRADRLQRLQDAGAALGRSLDEHEIVRELARHVLRLVPADGIVVAHPDVEHGIVRTALRQVRGLSRPRVDQPLGSGPLAEAARTGLTVRVDDYDPARSPLAAADDVVGDAGPAGAVIAMPMRVGTQLIGIVAVHASTPRAFRAEDEELLRAVASQAGTAIANARQFAESDGERRQSEALADVARAVGSSLRFGDVMRLVLRHTSALLRAGGACVALQREDYLHVVAGVGQASLLSGVHVPVGTSMMGRAMREARPYISNSVRDDDGYYRPLQRVTPIEKAVLVPLIGATGPIGVIVALNREADFTDADARVLQRLADHVAVAIVNARLFEEVTAATREWKVAFDAVAAGLVVLDEQGRITRGNERAAELIGASSPQELSGREFHEAAGLAPSDEASVVARALAGSEPARAIAFAMERGVWLDVLAAPHPNGGAVVTFDDVTAHQIARDALAASEARYRELFESATDAIYTLDERGVVTSANIATSHLAGVPVDEIVGASTVAYVHEADLAGARAHFAATLLGEPQHYECRMVSAQGVERLLSVTTAPLHGGEQGAVDGVLAIARDVTADRERAAALARSEAQYARLVESASDAIFTVDVRGRLTSINHAIERATGRSRGDLLGLPCEILLGHDEASAAGEVMDATLRGERIRREVRFRDVQGAMRIGSLVAAPVVEGGRVVGGLGVLRDVTDERRLAEQLMQRQKLTTVGRLVRGIAHELNNPLASVLALADLLVADAERSTSLAPDDVGDAALAIRAEARRASRIIGRLHAFAKQRAPERSATDVNRVVLDALDLRRYALRMQRVDIAVDLDYELPVTWADPVQLQEVFLQVVTTAELALGAMPDEPGARRLTIRTRRRGELLVAEFIDSGIGYDATTIARLLEPFGTDNETDADLAAGAEIVREHGGRIHVESSLGAGATVTVELPFEPLPAFGAESLAPISYVSHRGRGE